MVVGHVLLNVVMVVFGSVVLMLFIIKVVSVAVVVDEVMVSVRIVVLNIVGNVGSVVIITPECVGMVLAFVVVQGIPVTVVCVSSSSPYTRPWSCWKSCWSMRPYP